MIQSFKNKQTRHVWMGVWEEHLPNEVQDEGLKKLELLDHVRDLDELYRINADHLEKLEGDLAGYYSIRINSKWRVIFTWNGKDATNVQIVNYHK